MESLDELQRYQQSVLESIQQENGKRDEALKCADVNAQIAKCRLYINKLVAMKKDMEMITEKSDKIKSRAIKLAEEKQNEALKKELEVDRQKQLEASLSPVCVGPELPKARPHSRPSSAERDRDRTSSKASTASTSSSSTKHS